MSPDDNKALVRRFYEEIDAGNLDAMDELVAEDFVNHSGFPFPGITPDREGLKTAFEGDLPGIPATGNELRMSAVAVHRIADGKIAEHWSGKDELGLMIQLGVIPPPDQHG